LWSDSDRYAYEITPNKLILTGNIVGPSEQMQGSLQVPEQDRVREVRATNRANAGLGRLATGAEGVSRGGGKIRNPPIRLTS
jgi:hypothetical protein